MDFSKYILVIFLSTLTACGLGDNSNKAPEANEVLTVRETSERLIRSEIASAIDQGDLQPVCPDIKQAIIGTVFQCSVQVSDNRVLYVNGKIENDGRVSLETVNLLLKEDLLWVEDAAANYLNERLERSVPVTAIDCGDRSVILNSYGVILCSFNDPGTANIYDAKVKVSDISSKAVEVQISPTPRS